MIHAYKKIRIKIKKYFALGLKESMADQNLWMQAEAWL